MLNLNLSYDLVSNKINLNITPSNENIFNDGSEAFKCQMAKCEESRHIDTGVLTKEMAFRLMTYLFNVLKEN